MRILLEHNWPDEPAKVLYSDGDGLLMIELKDGSELRISEAETSGGSMLDINLEFGRMRVLPRAANVVWIGAVTHD